ncbi:MAG: 1-(5-phosphoribosyl)-5-[(5-phosphoribosylamino) methylideneamino]imidazole-4-carboxamide isomerase [Anaerolineae bacterium]
MIVYPAIDLRGGRVVRLKYGDPAQQTVYGDDPVAVAHGWRAAGAAWLHVVNLDGALSAAGAEATLKVVSALAVATGMRIQFGGGVRDADSMARAFDAGAARVVVGTAAARRPEFAAEMVACWGADRVAAALDVREGRVAVEGWQAASEWTPVALGQRLAALGVRHALYTDVSRDGAGTGVNVAATAELARATGLEVIASGGVARLDDVRALVATGAVAGVVIGRALYEGAVDLRAALAIAGGATA